MHVLCVPLQVTVPQLAGNGHQDRGTYIRYTPAGLCVWVKTNLKDMKNCFAEAIKLNTLKLFIIQELAQSRFNDD